MRPRLRSAPLVFVLAAGAAVASMPSAAADGGREIRMHDDCDPTSFNAAVGPGTCVGDGRTTFGAFIGELTATHQVAAWNFQVHGGKVGVNQPLTLANRGGEGHTFTQVKDFGGGFVPPLNDAGGFGATIPECDPATVQIVAPGTKLTIRTPAKPMLYKYQCCIHPWMRAVLTVRSDD